MWSRGPATQEARASCFPTSVLQSMPHHGSSPIAPGNGLGLREKPGGAVCRDSHSPVADGSCVMSSIAILSFPHPFVAKFTFTWWKACEAFHPPSVKGCSRAKIVSASGGRARISHSPVADGSCAMSSIAILSFPHPFVAKFTFTWWKACEAFHPPSVKGCSRAKMFSASGGRARIPLLNKTTGISWPSAGHPPGGAPGGPPWRNLPKSQ
jgi:hypothetical protein